MVIKKDIKAQIGKRIAFLEFRIQVVEELVHKDDTSSGQNSSSRPPTIGNPAHLSERYFISNISPYSYETGTYKVG
ncbi:hypothetical protein TNCV_4135701 [Trichonephila clavipes]|nr:hypothetical protein TNCV_4135701 [Trichonephila clavipes]